MAKWKLQAVEPDTCDPPGCRYLEWWDVEAPDHERVHIVAAFERVCPAHAATVPEGEMLGFDGNWKPRREYIEYQRAYFRRLNHVEWLARNPGEAMPPQIAGYTSDPVTTGSLPEPAQAARDGMARAYGLNRQHNAMKNHALAMVEAEGGERDGVTWAWEGAGDARTLTVRANGKLTKQQRVNVQAVADIQYGAGRIRVVD